MKLVKITALYLSLATQAGWFPRRGCILEQKWTCSVREIYNHTQHFYSTILSYNPNCCVRYKPIWNLSCINHNISNPPCCKLAQVVTLSSTPLNINLSVWLHPAVMQRRW